MHYSLEDVGEDKVKEWMDKLKLIGKVAFEKDNSKLYEDCQLMLKRAKEKWQNI